MVLDSYGRFLIEMPPVSGQINITGKVNAAHGDDFKVYLEVIDAGVRAYC